MYWEEAGEVKERLRAGRGQARGGICAVVGWFELTSLSSELLLEVAGAEAEKVELPSGNEGNEGIKAATDDQRLAEAVVGDGGDDDDACVPAASPLPFNFKFFISGVAVPDFAVTGGGGGGGGTGNGAGFNHFSKNLITGISETIVVWELDGELGNGR